MLSKGLFTSWRIAKIKIVVLTTFRLLDRWLLPHYVYQGGKVAQRRLGCSNGVILSDRKYFIGCTGLWLFLGWQYEMFMTRFNGALLEEIWIASNWCNVLSQYQYWHTNLWLGLGLEMDYIQQPILLLFKRTHQLKLWNGMAVRYHIHEHTWCNNNHQKGTLKATTLWKR